MLYLLTFKGDVFCLIEPLLQENVIGLNNRQEAICIMGKSTCSGS